MNFSWVLIAILTPNSYNAGPAMVTVDNIQSYQACKKLGDELRRSDHIGTITFSCHKVPKM